MMRQFYNVSMSGSNGGIEINIQAVWVFLWVAIPTIVLILAVVFVCLGVSHHYENFVEDHSEAIDKLLDIKKRFKFHDVPNMDMDNTYDNEGMYGDIKPIDYLTYELVFKQKEALEAIKKSRENASLLKTFEKDVAESCVLGRFDAPYKPSFEWLVLRKEKKIFEELSPKPTTLFSIKVTLRLTYMNGDRRGRKRQIFDENVIVDLIRRIRNKRGSFYEDRRIYESICRVERGKVSNHLRFAIYDRDGWRCLKCGRKTDDLEIDHIIPIAKGGKTEWGNLQTLCHRCNKEKGTQTIDYRRKK